jgi:hypothetical protein
MLHKPAGLLVGATLAFVGMAGAASAATTGTQRFTFIANFSGDQTTCRVIATGPITGVGTCDPEDVTDNVTVIHVTLPNGAFDVTVTTLSETDNLNQQACVDRFTNSESFVVSGVSGAYANATGNGTDTLRGVFTADRTPNGCDENSGSGFIVAQGTGPVTL